MLDEKLEYKQITDENLLCKRLRYSSLEDGLSGIERPMTIIARKFIWEYAKHFRKEEQIFAAKSALRAWCGHKYKNAYYKLKDGKTDEWVYCSKEDFEAAKIPEQNQLEITTPLKEKFYIEIDPESEYKTEDAILAKCPKLFSDKIPNCTFDEEIINEITRINNWLPNYIEKLSINKGKDKKENILNILKGKKYGRNLFNKEFNDIGTDSTKTITYEKIIANAFVLGRLKTYALKCAVNEKINVSEELKTTKRSFDKKLEKFKNLEIPSKLAECISKETIEDIVAEVKKIFENFENIPNCHKNLDELFFPLTRNIPKEGQKTYKASVDKIIDEAKKMQKNYETAICVSPKAFDNIVKVTINKQNEKHESPLNEKEQQYLLMLVAYFLIETSKCPYPNNDKRHHKIWFNKTDFKNWSAWEVPTTKLSEIFLHETGGKGANGNPEREALFFTESNSNTIKLWINDEWLKNTGIKIVEGPANTKEKGVIVLSEHDLISFGKTNSKKDDKNDK